MRCNIFSAIPENTQQLGMHSTTSSCCVVEPNFLVWSVHISVQEQLHATVNKILPKIQVGKRSASLAHSIQVRIFKSDATLTDSLFMRACIQSWNNHKVNLKLLLAKVHWTWFDAGDFITNYFKYNGIIAVQVGSSCWPTHRVFLHCDILEFICFLAFGFH